MGRWGNALYQSDAALEFFGDISDQVEQELYGHLTALEDDSRADLSAALAGMLTAIEILLLFDQEHATASASLHHYELIASWRATFFAVWDDDWQDDDDAYAHGQPAYRRKHRAGVKALFDRLESIARYWTTLKHGYGHEFTPLHPDYPLPFFSIQRRKTEDNREYVSTEGFVEVLIETLVRDIIYWLSPEKRSEAEVYNTEDVWVAVHLLGLLCEKFEQTCGIQAQFIRGWRKTTLDIWKAFDGDRFNAEGSLVQNVMAVFDRLDAVAQKHPAREW